jgi:hypothetical protein
MELYFELGLRLLSMRNALPDGVCNDWRDLVGAGKVGLEQLLSAGHGDMVESKDTATATARFAHGSPF